LPVYSDAESHTDNTVIPTATAEDTALGVVLYTIPNVLIMDLMSGAKYGAVKRIKPAILPKALLPNAKIISIFAREQVPVRA
jgi:hypothetical protein